METNKQNLLPQLRICFDCKHKYTSYKGFVCSIIKVIPMKEDSERYFAWHMENLIAINKHFCIPDECPYLTEHIVHAE